MGFSSWGLAIELFHIRVYFSFGSKNNRIYGTYAFLLMGVCTHKKSYNTVFPFVNTAFIEMKVVDIFIRIV